MHEIIAKYTQFFPNGWAIGGASCGKGWLPLLDKMFAEIQQYCTTNNISELPQVVQIKEKFGTLRVYMNNTNDVLEDIVFSYSSESISICEECGNPGEQKTYYGWIKTLCSVCDTPQKE